MKAVFTTFEISRLCDVDISTVIKWIDAGKLSAYKTPGGHRRIRKDDLLSFLKAFRYPVPRGLQKASSVVLIIDEDTHLEECVRSRWEDAAVYRAEDGFEAGKLLAEKQPSLVVLDFGFPGIDARQVCRVIRADRRFKRTRILALRNAEQRGPETVAVGADDSIVKPCTMDDLLKRIEKLLPELHPLS